MFHIKSALPSLVRRLAAGQRGVTAIVTAMALVVLLGFAALAIDVGAWLNATRGLQAAADQGAYSAASAAGTTGCSGDAATTQARAVVAMRGYVDNQDGAQVDITCNSGNATFTVKISQIQPMWFSRLFLSTPPTASGLAVAQLAGKDTDLCILALDGTNVSEGITGNDASAFWLNGNTTVNLHCGVAVDSGNIASLATGGSASLIATDIYLVGDDQGSPGGSSTIATSPTANNVLRNQIPVQDPYAGRVIPRLSSCGANGSTGTTVNTSSPLNPAVFCGGLTIGGSSPNTVTLNPGIYYIVGGSLTFNAKATVTGDGVTFVLTGNTLGQTGYATLTINGGPQNSVSLTAPTSGPTGGMVFFQDHNAPSGGSSSNTTSCGSGTSQNQINGGSSQLLTGAIYFPNQSVCYGGGSSTTGAGKCTQIIAHTISFTGNSNVQSVCAGTGISPISVLTPQLIL